MDRPEVLSPPWNRSSSAMHLSFLVLAALGCAAAWDLRVVLVASSYLDQAGANAAVASTLARRVAFVKDVEVVQTSFDLADAVGASDCVAFGLADAVGEAFDRVGRVEAASDLVDRAEEAFDLVDRAEAASDRAGHVVGAFGPVVHVLDVIEVASTLEASRLAARSCLAAHSLDGAQACPVVVAAVVASEAEVQAAAAFEGEAERVVIPA